MLECLLNLKDPLITSELIHPIISLMSAKDIHAVRHMLERTTEKDVDISLVSDKFCKSLKETCRYVLYENIKDGRMAVHVKSLPLPTLLKKYLCFDYEINEENLQLGMRNVKQ